MTKLRNARKRKGWSLRQAEDVVPLSHAQISRLERNPDAASIATLKEFAKSYGCRLEDLIDVSTQGVIVRGEVNAGAWRESYEWSIDEQYSYPIPQIPGYEDALLFGLEVKGDSMDKKFSPGTVLICSPLIEQGREPTNGEYVIAVRYDSSGQQEATCKRFHSENGQSWLMPESTNPTHQAPVMLTDATTDRVEIIATVVRYFGTP